MLLAIRTGKLHARESTIVPDEQMLAFSVAARLGTSRTPSNVLAVAPTHLLKPTHVQHKRPTVEILAP
jgi:hypothetical protein